MPRIAMAHNIPYVATASVSNLHDLEAKVQKAMTFRGARYLHIFVPCPLGWGLPADQTIKIARLAHECGMFPLFEAEHGTVTSSVPIREKVPVEDYLKPQRRFAHLFKKGSVDTERIARLQAIADANIREYGLLREQSED